MEFKESPDESKELNILVYGKSGSGKTPFSATVQDIPGTEEALFISCEGGETSIQHRDIPVVRVDNYDDFDTVYQFLHKHQLLRQQGNKEGLLQLHNEFHGTDADKPTLYDSVVVDSLTEAQVFCKYDILDFDYQESLSNELDDMNWEGWKEMSEKIGRLCRDFKSLNMHVVFTALLSQDQDERTGKIERGPKLEGGASDEVPGIFDLLLCMKPADDDDDAFSKVLTQGRDGYLARDRFQSLDPVLIDPTIPDIFETVYNK